MEIVFILFSLDVKKSLFSSSVHQPFLLGRMLHIFSKSFLLRFKAVKLLFGSLVILTYLIYWFACEKFLMGMIFRSDLNKHEILAVTRADC